MRPVLIAVLIVAACAQSHAQDTTVRQANGPMLALGNGRGAWVVEVTTSGGFTGRGRGNFAVRVDGVTACTPPMQCATLAPHQLSPVANAVGQLITERWTPEPSRSVCNDCVLTTMTLRKRDANGVDVMRTFSWTEVTWEQVPRDVGGIYQAVMELARAGAAVR